jgi:hypothetical protein
MNEQIRDDTHNATAVARTALESIREWTSASSATNDQLSWVIQLLHEIDTYATLSVDELEQAARRLVNFIEAGP